MAIRKNLTTLTAAEKTELIKAFKGLKKKGIYDTYVRTHFDAGIHPSPPGGSKHVRTAAHMGPTFFPWHREFIRRFEADLQKEAKNPNLGLPYWDWGADADLPDPKQGVIWGNDFLGGSGTPVTTGQFTFNPANPTDPNGWPINFVHLHDAIADTDTFAPIVPPRGLNRQLGVDIPTLPTTAQAEEARAIGAYDSDPWNMHSGEPPNSGESFRNVFEGWMGMGGSQPPGLHNRVHVWVGGDMGPFSSPNDPSFFFHHCFVDKEFVEWQLDHPNAKYLPQTNGPDGQNWEDAMFPWTTTPKAVWNHRALGYSFDNEGQGCLRKITRLFH